MRRGVLAVGSIRGIEIRVHLSWVLIVALLVVGIGGDLLPTLHPEWPAAVHWLTAGVIAFLTFASVAAHELAHALVGRRRGIPTSSITLYFFGGTAAIESEAAGPGDEIRVAAAGPLASFGLAILFLAIGVAADLVATGWSDLVSVAAAVLAAFNIVLAVVNLVPGFPLDGGRILRAAIWRVSGDERRATRLASSIGRILGAGMVLGGFMLALYGATFDGLAVILCGWLLSNASRMVDRRALLEDLVAGISVGEAMERDVAGVAPQLTLDTFAEQVLARGPGSGLPVLRDGELLGVLGTSQLKAVRRTRWPVTRAAEVMVAPPTLPVLLPEMALWAGLEALQRSGLDGLPVMHGRDLLGILTRRGVGTAIQTRSARLGAMAAGLRGRRSSRPDEARTSGRPTAGRPGDGGASDGGTAETGGSVDSSGGPPEEKP